MLSRRSFFAAAAGALAGAAVAAAAPAPVVIGVDWAVAPDFSAFVLNTATPEVLDDWANDNPLRFEPNDLTREQYAANLPVIGRDALPADKPVPRACKPGAPAKETQEQYRRRVGTKCPGMLE